MITREKDEADMVRIKRFSSALLPGIEFGPVRVTPEVAAEWLEMLPERQRGLSKTTVNAYAFDMLAKAWAFTGESIKFNTDGNLVDGQHRLRAIMASGQAQIIFVFWNLDIEAIVSMDTGRKRTFGDLLKMAGVGNHTSVAAVTVRAVHWSLNNYGDRSVARAKPADFLHVNPTLRMLADYYDDNEEDLRRAALKGQNMTHWAGKDTCPPSVFSFIYLLLSRYDVFEADRFFTELASQTPGPATAVLQAKIKNAARDKNRTGEIAEAHWIHWFIGTWNAFLNMKSQGTLARKALTVDTVHLPIDPHFDTRSEGWEPL